jgi:transcriptional regulator with XRE-family HTH domain
MKEVNSEEIRRDVRRAVDRLVENRKRLGLSQYRLAQLTGLSREAVRKVEGGERVPTLHTFLLLCNALEADPAKLLI